MDRLACSGINQIIVLIECKPLKGNSHFPAYEVAKKHSPPGASHKILFLDATDANSELPG